MKSRFSIILMFMSSIAFSQVKKDSVKTELVFIRSYYDTIGVKVYYEDGDFIKVNRKAFAVRLIETNSSDHSKDHLVSLLYYDEKMKPFTKTIVQSFPR